MSTTGFSKAQLGRMHDVLAAYVESGEVAGLVTLLSRGGEVHVDMIGMKAVGNNNPMTHDTIFRLDSMTKPITAAAAMILVDEYKLQLDEPVDRLLPELSNRRVLRRPEGPLDETVPAIRPITLRDLLTLRLGIGLVMAPPGMHPIQKAMDELGLSPGPNLPSYEPDEWLSSLGSLPLVHQPGERWMYHTGFDILGILIARAAGQSLEDFLRERIFEPLGMKDTGFYVPAEKLGRLSTSYMTNPETGALMVHDHPDDSIWSRSPIFPSGGSGLVSTVDDYRAFCQMMLNKGQHGGVRILSRQAVELMTTDQLTPEQKAGASAFLSDNSGWGFGVAVNTRSEELRSTPGRYGWDGGVGTSAYSDPREDLIGILMTQRYLDSPEPPRIFLDFWNSFYQAIDGNMEG